MSKVDYGKVHWLVDEILQERQYDCGFPTIAEAAKNLGCQVYQTKYIPFSDRPDENIPFPNGPICVISHGSIQFIRQIQRWYTEWCPGAYFVSKTESFSTFAAHYGSDMLNDEFYMLPYGEFVRRGLKEGERVFIKPNAGFKEFTGKVIAWDNFNEETNSMKQIEIVDPESLIIVAPVKDIKAEFRYVIVNGKVITGSEYRWDNTLDVRVDTLPECDDMAWKVAKHEWQPDYAYVCDIAMTESGPKIIELNAFSSSGLYACDTNKIVKAISDMAWKECNGDQD